MPINITQELNTQTVNLTTRAVEQAGSTCKAGYVAGFNKGMTEAAARFDTLTAYLLLFYVGHVLWTRVDDRYNLEVNGRNVGGIVEMLLYGGIGFTAAFMFTLQYFPLLKTV